MTLRNIQRLQRTYKEILGLSVILTHEMRISITTRNHTLTIPTFHDSYASTTYLSNPCPRRTHEVAQQSTPLATSLAITCTSLKLCHFSSFLPFSTVCLQVFFGLPASLSIRSPGQRSSDVRTVVPLENMAYPSPMHTLDCS